MRLTLSISVVTLFLFISIPDAFSQVNPYKLTLSIFADNTTFTATAGQKAKVKARIENKTGQALKMDTLAVTFNLSTHGKDLGKCRFRDCFVSNSIPGKRIENGEAFEFEVNLAYLYWNNLIANGFDLRQPKNMFRVITSGEYQLFMEFAFPDEEHSTKADPRQIAIRSNEILIRLHASDK
jgi:hypothetical protein